MTGARGEATLRQIDRLFGAGTVAGLSDAQLLDRFLTRRDAPAFEALVARHGPMVLATCRGLLGDEHAVEDAFQATFLILARKGGAIRGRAVLGGWLHRVAHRVAVQACADASRRRAREHRAVVLRSADEPHAGLQDEERAAVHEELARLPERYRLPVVLCYLGGRTHAEAATELRCGEATVRRRLAAARERLRSRLSRRGVAPAVVLQRAVSSGQGTPAVPSAWTVSAVEVAVKVTTGRALTATAGVVPASVAALAASVLRARHFAQLRSVGTAFLAVAAVAVLAAGIAARDDGDDPRPAPAAEAKPDANPGRTVRGQVLDPSGRPVARAKVYLWMLERLREPAHDPAPSAVSDEDGRFVFEVRSDALDRTGTRAEFGAIIAMAERFGPAWHAIAAGRLPADCTLRLAEDLPVEGRILDLEGRPVAGARVGLLWLAIPKDGVSGFLSALQNQPELKAWLPGDYHSWIGRLPGQPAFVDCDAAGRFRLTGLGRDRLAELVLQGPGIADGTAMVLTRRMDRVVGPASRRPQPEPPPPLTVYGAAFDYVAPPSRPIVGIVRDRATGAPIAGVRVTSRRMPGKDMSGEDPPGSITDAAGRYALDGHPKAGSYAAAAVPAPGAPYLVGHAEVADKPGTGPLQADIALARGIPFRVRPVDAVTGRPVVAEVSYYPLHPNPHVRGPVGFGAAGGGPLSRARANPDGSYSGVALPGPGAICVENRQEIYLPVKINPRAFFKPGQPATDPLDHVYGDESWLIVEQGEQGLWFFPHEQFQAIVLINPDEGSGPVEREAVLVPARKVEGTVLGPDGQPLPGAEVYQMDGYRVWTVPLPGSTFTATKVDPDRPRKVFFRHVGRKLAGMLVVPTAGDEPPTVQLRPWATLSGRLVDAEGRPRPGLQLATLFTPAMKTDRNSGEFTEWLRTDTAGRFRIEGLVPGLRYSLNVTIESSFSEGSNLFKDVILEPGETRDLGDVREESHRSMPAR